MKRKLYILTVLYIFTCVVLNAQIGGQIIDKKDGTPIPGAIVTLTKENTKGAIAYCRSDDEGHFSIKVEPREGLTLRVSMLGYSTDSTKVVSQKNYYVIKIAEEATVLNEVVVTAEPIRAQGDTVTYLVSNFSEIQDKSLADVLKKMPGIEVGDRGQIKYQGVSINRFYIEGRDMLGERYGVATNTINPDDVGAVEVLENHQPIKAMNDISFSQNPAINIKLKEDAKSRLVGTSNLGAGFLNHSPAFLWDAQLSLMRFKKSKQMLATAKTSNVGRPASSINRELELSEESSRWSDNYSLSAPFSISGKNPNQLGQEKTRIGPTHMASINNLWGLSEDIDLTSRVNYSHQTDDSQNTHNLIYYFKEGEEIIESEENAHDRNNHLSIETNLLVNKSHLYVKNRLIGRYDWDKSNLNTLGTFPNEQRVSAKNGVIENNLDFLIRKGQKGYAVHSYIKWQKQPSVLRIRKGDNHIKQDISSQLFFSNTNTRLSYIFNGHEFSTKLGISTMRRQFQSDLVGFELDLSPLDNNLSVNSFQIYGIPAFSFHFNAFEGDLSLPIYWTSYTFKNDEKRNEQSFAFAPMAQLALQATNRLKFKGIAKYFSGILNDQEWYDGYVLRNYHVLSLGLNELNKHDNFNASIGADYKNALDALFANISFGFSHLKSTQMNSRDFKEGYMIYKLIPQINSGSMFTLSGNSSKGLMWWHTTLGIRGFYSFGKQEVYLQDELTSYQFRNAMLKAYLSSRPTSWLSLSYAMTFNRIGERLKGNDKHFRNNYSQNLEVVLTPMKLFRVELMGDYYYNEISDHVKKHYFLIDAGIVYSPNDKWELSLAARNLLNNRMYGYTMFSSLTSQSVNYNIRPFEVLLSLFLRI